MIRRDIKIRSGVSKYAIWIPTLWLGIIASRPLSSWLGIGGGVDTMEGSPMDRLFFMAMIAAAMVLLLNRAINWSAVVVNAWPILLFYLFLLVSVLWADSAIVSFKRWFKDFGNVVIALVILTEKNPSQAFRAVFVRCAYFLIPLSVIYVRWFPDKGRRYSGHTGAMEVLGVTDQKNTLGALIVVCGIVLVWDWLEQREENKPLTRIDRWRIPCMIVLAGYMLYQCDSQTSLLCWILATAILFTSRVKFFQRRLGTIGAYAIGGLAAFLTLDYFFHIKEFIVVDLMGRNMTFTGRTDVWQTLLSLNTDPLFGTGFCSFWSDEHYQSQLPPWVAASAHNGYLEMYIDGGWFCLFFLAVMLAASAFRLNKRLSSGSLYSLLRFGVLVATIVGNLSESHYGRMSPLWFMFILVTLDPRSPTQPTTALVNDLSETPDLEPATSPRLHPI